MSYLTLDEIEENARLTNLTPQIKSDYRIEQPDTNRPALQLTGYYEHFAADRVQIIGNVEYYYMEGLERGKRNAAFEEFVSKDIPCVVFTGNNMPDQELLDIAVRHNVPVYLSTRSTANFAAELITWMHAKLAPMISIHGELLDIFGEGVLITGESGIGKSEAALELVKRGHRLVSDDVVQIKRINDDRLSGSAPDITKYLVELRGIGVIDVKELFGVQSVEEYHKIDMEIHLIDGAKHPDFSFDRLGMNEEYAEYMDSKIVKHTIPVRPGRNIAVIIETAALNVRQKKMGYNAAEVLYKRVQENMMKNRK